MNKDVTYIAREGQVVRLYCGRPEDGVPTPLELHPIELQLVVAALNAGELTEAQARTWPYAF